MDQLLLIDKPVGITSHDAVDAVRRAYHTRRVGHAGTLDPFASGLLIIGIGSATKQLTALVGLDKEYVATLCLGITSTTFDPEGELKITDPHSYEQPTPEDIERVLQRFRGSFTQIAPLYSAKKIHGKKLYELARKGLATEDMRPSKQVTISELSCTGYTWPTLSLRVSCSSGTYIRSLADDIGRELGCGAYLTQLRRTRIGTFSIDKATCLDKLASS